MASYKFIINSLNLIDEKLQFLKIREEAAFPENRC